jgi:hypothetical protein
MTESLPVQFTNNIMCEVLLAIERQVAHLCECWFSCQITNLTQLESWGAHC